MKYSLKTPCDNCPFRTDVKPYVHPRRAAGIVGNAFACHKTTTHDYAGEHVETEKEQHCAGSLIFHEHLDRPHQMMRIMERIGQYDRSKLDMAAPVYRDLEDLLSAYEAAEKEQARQRRAQLKKELNCGR